MPIQTRLPYTFPNPGPFLAKVTNHLDTTYMGSLEVVLIKGYANDPELQSQTYIVNYLSPFYGISDIKFEGNNPEKYDDVQKSYGMWMIPPDVGTTVMVIFLDGDPNQGYWMGCILNDRFQNHMVPGIAASKNAIVSAEQKLKYNVDYLPVGEFHKRSTKATANPNNIPKPIHPFAEKLLKQGLLADRARGVTSSSARREVPSAVFGISTPGRINPNGKKGQVGYDTKATVSVSRETGHTFVMDDGDTAGDNQLIRIRSSSGHQILLNDTSNLLYIANADGTAWIEMTASGKIDIYSEDSISIHSKADFNFRATRDINLEAGRNININAIGSADVNIGEHLYVTANGAVKMAFAKTLDTTVAGTSKTSIGESQHINIGGSGFYSANEYFNIASESNMRISSGSSIHLGAVGNIFATGQTKIHLNGPAAEAANPAENAEAPTLLPSYKVPATNLASGWSNGVYYQTTPLTTILQRVPMHEPWVQHESSAPASFSAAKTDISLISRPDVVPVNASAPDISEAPVNLPASLPGTCTTTSIKAISAASAQAGIAALKAACSDAKPEAITSPYAVASILAIAGGECAWVPQKELYSFSSSALQSTFSKTFRGKPELADKYARWKGTREDFFNFVYAPENNGSSLGNTEDGDGGKFYGRGFIQLTGRANYTKYGKLAGVDLVNNPELLNSDITISAKVAVAYFKDRVKKAETDTMYFDSALAAIGGARSHWDKKRDYYNCFLANLQGGTIGTGSGGVLIDGQGNPVKPGG